jgi:hypothetical protein
LNSLATKYCHSAISDSLGEISFPHQQDSGIMYMSENMPRDKIIKHKKTVIIITISAKMATIL